MLVALLVFAAGCGDGDGGSNTTTQAAPDGSFAVGSLNFVFVDTSRPTAANNGVPAKDSRTLRSVVYYPATGMGVGAPAVSGRRFPLIVFAHGFMALARIYGPILQAWGAAGYVVVAPDFPLSSGASPGGPVLEDYVNQPADESFLIDQMLALNDDAASPLHDLIDAERIGVSGHSLGGMTTFGAGFHTCCREPRIDAAVPMAGRLMPFPDGEYDAMIGPPVLIIHGDDDESVAYQDAIDAYAFASPPKLLLTHLGGRHVPPYVGGSDIPALTATIDASTAFFDLYLKNEQGSRERLLEVGTRDRIELVHMF